MKEQISKPLSDTIGVCDKYFGAFRKHLSITMYLCVRDVLGNTVHQVSTESWTSNILAICSRLCAYWFLFIVTTGCTDAMTALSPACKYGKSWPSAVLGYSLPIGLILFHVSCLCCLSVAFTLLSLMHHCRLLNLVANQYTSWFAVVTFYKFPIALFCEA